MNKNILNGFKDELDKLSGIPMINGQRLTPEGLKFLKKYRGEGPWDSYDMTEAVMSHEEKTGEDIPDSEYGKRFYKKPLGWKDKPGFLNKIRRGIGSGGKSPYYEK